MYTKEQRGIECNELPHSSWWINEKWQFHWKLLSLVFFFFRFEKPNLAHSRVFQYLCHQSWRKALKDVYNYRRCAINHLIFKKNRLTEEMLWYVAWCSLGSFFRYISWASRWTRNFLIFSTNGSSRPPSLGCLIGFTSLHTVQLGQLTTGNVIYSLTSCVTLDKSLIYSESFISTFVKWNSCPRYACLHSKMENSKFSYKKVNSKGLSPFLLVCLILSFVLNK